ncbi:hypothetical protein ACFX2I_022404 [Malus domestica]
MGANLFSGEIPPELGSLSSFQIAMNLSFNNFTGRIPPALGNLNLLEFLLLNNNHLTGEIPSTFEGLSSLLGCNFSYNDLTGALPSTPLFQNMEISSFIGNKGLCGGSLGGCNVNSSPQSVPSLESGVTHRSKIVTVIAAAVGGVSLILIAVILYFMRRPGQRVPSLQYKDALSPDTDMYLPAKEGFTFQDLVEATNNFHESYVIGRRACGIVYKAVMRIGQTIAVKKLSSNRESNNIENSFQAEIKTLGNIRHRNIVKLYGFCYHQGSNLLLYKYMAKGVKCPTSVGIRSHNGFIENYPTLTNTKGLLCLDWPTRFLIALGAAEDENFEAHVGDFGLAKVIDMRHSKSMSAVAGSYGYIAPEYAYTMRVAEKCDIYSYGVVLLELLTGRTPVQSLDQGGHLVTWSNEQDGDFLPSPTFNLPSKDATDLLKDDADLPLTDDTR